MWKSATYTTPNYLGHSYSIIEQMDTNKTKQKHAEHYKLKSMNLLEKWKLPWYVKTKKL